MEYDALSAEAAVLRDEKASEKKRGTPGLSGAVLAPGVIQLNLGPRK